VEEWERKASAEQVNEEEGNKSTQKREESKGRRNRLTTRPETRPETRPRKKSIRPPSPTPLQSHLLPVLWSILPHYFFYFLFPVLTCREKSAICLVMIPISVSLIYALPSSDYMWNFACRVFIRLTSKVSEVTPWITWENDILFWLSLTNLAVHCC